MLNLSVRLGVLLKMHVRMALLKILRRTETIQKICHNNLAFWEPQVRLWFMDPGGKVSHVLHPYWSISGGLQTAHLCR